MTETSTIVLEKNKTRTIHRKKVKVVAYNDDVTTFECVIEVLMTVFAKTEQEAFSIAMNIHKGGPMGRAIIGEYSRNIAESKVAKAKKLATTLGYPNFKIIVEE